MTIIPMSPAAKALVGGWWFGEGMAIEDSQPLQSVQSPQNMTPTPSMPIFPIPLPHCLPVALSNLTSFSWTPSPQSALGG